MSDEKNSEDLIDELFRMRFELAEEYGFETDIDKIDEYLARGEERSDAELERVRDEMIKRIFENYPKAAS